MASKALEGVVEPSGFTGAHEPLHVLRGSSAPWTELVTAPFLQEWRELENLASEPNPFLSAWSLHPALEQLDAGASCELFTVRTDGRLIGLLPIARQASYYRYPLPNVRSWLHANAFCGTPMIARGHEEAFWSELLEWADANAGTGLFLHLTHLPSDGPAYAALRTVLAHQNRAGAIVQREERALLRSGVSSTQHFEQSMSGKKRKELRRQAKRLTELGALSHERLTGPEGVSEWTAEFLSLEQQGWKGREGSSLACNSATNRMFETTMAGAAEAGKLERLALRLDGKAIAMLINFITLPGAFSYKTTFDENFARFSPGVLLQQDNLGLLDRSDIHWCDSCASADHPMIERLWRDRRTIVRVSIAIGGKARQALARQIMAREAIDGAIGL